MKKIIFFLFIAGILTPLAGCSAGQGKDRITVTTEKTEYQIGEPVSITIQNRSEKPVRVLAPSYTVERLTDKGEWKVIGRVSCPCGAICDMMGWQSAGPGKDIGYEWIQKETRCSKGPLREQIMLSEQVPEGNYRIKIRIAGKNASDERKIYSAIFKIKENK